MALVSSFDYSYGIATIIDFFIILVAGLISYQSYRIYKYVYEKKYALFSISFSLIALSYLFKIISNLTIVHRVIIKRTDSMVIVAKEITQYQFVNFISFVLYEAFLIIGFLILFLIIVKSYKKTELALLVYLSCIVIIFSLYVPLIFYLTVSIILIVLSYKFYENYLNQKSGRSLFVFSAFFTMFIGGVLGVLSSIYKIHHLVSEVFFLIGFLLLLINHLTTTKKHGKKKDKTRSN